MTSSSIKTVTADNFEAEVTKASGLVMVEFYSDWCGPCKSLAPTLEQFAAEHAQNVKVVKINVDESPELAAAFGIKSIPTIVSVKDGRAIYGAIGNLPKKALEQFLGESLKTPPVPPKKPTL